MWYGNTFEFLSVDKVMGIANTMWLVAFVQKEWKLFQLDGREKKHVHFPPANFMILYIASKDSSRIHEPETKEPMLVLR